MPGPGNIYGITLAVIEADLYAAATGKWDCGIERLGYTQPVAEDSKLGK